MGLVLNLDDKYQRISLYVAPEKAAWAVNGFLMFVGDTVSTQSVKPPEDGAIMFDYSADPELDLDDSEYEDAFSSPLILRCRHCKDLVDVVGDGTARHCACGRIGVDGSADFLRLVGRPEDRLLLSVSTEIGTA